MTPHHLRRAAFTMVEMVVVLGVLSVLLAILLPALRGARIASLERAELAHQRQVGFVLSFYEKDNAGRFPSFGISGTNDARMELDGHVLWGEGAYWEQPFFWGLHAWIEGYAEASMSWWGPARPHPIPTRDQILHQPNLLSSYASSDDVLTYTAFAPPTFWSPSHPQPHSDQAPQRWNTIAFPSQKAILIRHNFARWTIGVDDPPDTQLLWMADGHGAIRDESTLGPATTLRFHVPDPIPGLTTLHGLHGRDL